MSNGINQRQNEEKCIAMLAAQRQLYSDAKKLDWTSTVLSVLIPFLLSCILLFVPKDSPVGVISYIVSIVSMIFSFCVSGHIKNEKRMAAFIQQKFDTYVYIMPWNRRIFGDDKNVSSEIAQYSEKILSNRAEKEKLKNWYTVEADRKPLNEGILVCQRENFTWDAGLRKRFRMLSIGVVVLLSGAVLIMGVILNESVIELLCRIAFLVPMLQWLFETVKMLNEDLDNLNELDAAINSKSEKSMEDLQDIQKLIYEHRKGCYTIPNRFYNLFKNNDEDRAHRMASM